MSLGNRRTTESLPNVLGEAGQGQARASPAESPEHRLFFLFFLHDGEKPRKILILYCMEIKVFFV